VEEFLKDHGFTFAEDDPDILEAQFTEEESTYLADSLGITDAYDTLIVQYNVATDEGSIFVDGEVYDVDASELMAALEGDA